MARDARPQTLLEHARQRVGCRNALRVMTYMVAWQIAREDIGHEPTAEQYGQWWKESPATAYREQALFRRAFPNESNPARLLDRTAPAWATRPSRRPSPAALSGAVLPA